MAIDPLKGVSLPQPWRGWFERLRTAANDAATKVSGMTEDNVFVADANGDLKDSGSALPIGTLVTATTVGEQYITEAPLPEAGTEEGARHGSFRIGLLTENDYAFFDENGKLIFYGITGVQILSPLNDPTIPTKFAVFDSTGNLKYRTAEQLASDLSGYLATRDYVAETFITENLLEEAQISNDPFIYSEELEDDGFFLLPEITNCGFGTVTIGSGGVIEASAEFEIDSTGTVNLIRAVDATIAVNVADPGTDGKFNIGIGTTNPVICKNRLGGPRRPLFRFWYN